MPIAILSTRLAAILPLQRGIPVHRNLSRPLTRMLLGLLQRIGQRLQAGGARARWHAICVCDGCAGGGRRGGGGVPGGVPGRTGATPRGWRAYSTTSWPSAAYGPRRSGRTGRAAQPRARAEVRRVRVRARAAALREPVSPRTMQVGLRLFPLQESGMGHSTLLGPLLHSFLRHGGRRSERRRRFVDQAKLPCPSCASMANSTGLGPVRQIMEADRCSDLGRPTLTFCAGRRRPASSRARGG